MSATSNIGQTFSPLLLKASTDTSTHLASDSGSDFVKDVSRTRPARSPIPIQRGQGGGMMDSQEMAIAMPRNEYASTSGKGVGTSLLYSTGAGHIDFARRGEED